MITTILWIVWVAMVVAWAGFHIYSALSKKNCREITSMLANLQLVMMLIIQLLTIGGRE